MDFPNDASGQFLAITLPEGTVDEMACFPVHVVPDLLAHLVDIVIVVIPEQAPFGEQVV